jgi:hypothetical protein
VRPTVKARLQRQYLYAFSAVSPHDGVMDSLVLPWVSAQTMSLFLAEVAQRHVGEFVLMVMDRAGWHLAGQLQVTANSAVERTLTAGLRTLETDPERTHSMTGFEWITSISLNATSYQGTLAVPTGIVSAELVSHATRREPTTRTCQECLSEGHSPTARFCRDCGAQLPAYQRDAPPTG